MKTPIRVHIVRTHWTHWGAHAGIVRYFDFLDPTAFTIHDKPTVFVDERISHPHRQIHDWAQGYLRRNRMPWYQLGDFWAECTAAQRALRRKADVIHFLDPEHGLQFLPGWMQRVPRSLRPRIVATFHQPPDLLPHILRPDVIALLDHVNVVSPDQAPFFEACLPSDRVSVILHGIDTTFFAPLPTRETSATWNCITVGHNLRDFDALRGVAEQMHDDPRVVFHVVTSEITGVEDLPNVVMHRAVSDFELRRLYQMADVLFLPLKSATANNALLEGFACGLPTVTTDLPGLRAYAPDGQAILIRDNDPVILHAALTQLRDNPARCAQLRDAARQRALALRWEQIAPAYAAMYRGDTGEADIHPIVDRV